jgi:membrane-associated protease RseP (regulator of RpoE activity)
MKRFMRYALVFGGLAVAATVLIGGAAAFATHDDDDVKVVTNGKVKVVTVDDDGNTHEKVIVLDDDDLEKRAFLGVAIRSSDSDDFEGAKIASVMDDTPAERAGLEKGDVIVGFNGYDIDSPKALTKMLRGAAPGDNVDIDVMRDGDRQTFSVELGEHAGFHGLMMHSEDGQHFLEHFKLEDLHEHLGELHENLGDLHLKIPKLHGLHKFHFGGRPKLGVQLVDTTPELREHLGGSPDAGVLVGKVLSGMPAEEGGIQVGDLIVSADGEDVEDSGDLVHALRDKDGDTISLGVIRDGRPMTLDIFIPEREIEEGEGPQAELLEDLDFDFDFDFDFELDEAIEGQIEAAIEQANLSEELVSQQIEVAIHQAMETARGSMEQAREAMERAKAAAVEAKIAAEYDETDVY